MTFAGRDTLHSEFFKVAAQPVGAEHLWHLRRSGERPNNWVLAFGEHSEGSLRFAFGFVVDTLRNVLVDFVNTPRKR